MNQRINTPSETFFIAKFSDKSEEIFRAKDSNVVLEILKNRKPVEGSPSFVSIRIGDFDELSNHHQQ